MRGGMEPPTFLLLSNNIQHSASAYIGFVITQQNECRKTNRFELYQYYEFGTHLTVNKNSYTCMAICLKKTHANVHWGHSLDQRHTNTTNIKFHTSSQTLPLPAHALPNHLHYFTKDCHHLYFWSTWFVYYCDKLKYVSIINIYFAKKFE